MRVTMNAAKTLPGGVYHAMHNERRT